MTAPAGWAWSTHREEWRGWWRTREQALEDARAELADGAAPGERVRVYLGPVTLVDPVEAVRAVVDVDDLLARAEDGIDDEPACPDGSAVRLTWPEELAPAPRSGPALGAEVDLVELRRAEREAERALRAAARAALEEAVVGWARRWVASTAWWVEFEEEPESVDLELVPVDEGGAGTPS